MPGNRRVKAPLSGLPEHQPPARELDLQRCAELLADASEGAAGRAAPQLLGLDDEDVQLALFGQVVSDRTADDAASDDRRRDAFRNDVDLLRTPGPGLRGRLARSPPANDAKTLTHLPRTTCSRKRGLHRLQSASCIAWSASARP
jgi:hypothetical protein